jgi:phosphoribosyl 1,2-cyclic phosphodiesterase
MRVTFCGVRGSTPAPGAAFLRYGGNTSCVAVQAADEPIRLLLDAGTGIAGVTAMLDGPYDGTILLGHLHWDHTHGLPFFGAGGAAGSRVRVLMPQQEPDAETVLARAFSPPHFPILPAQLGDGWTFAGIEEGEHHIAGFDLLAREIPHKGGRTFGYRVSAGGHSLAYLSDHSPSSLGAGPDGLGERHEAALALADGVDVLIHDAQHRAAEFPGVGYLGHASAEYAVALGEEAGARAVVLFHHAPGRSDDDVDAMVRSVQHPGLVVLAAHEGLVMDLAEVGQEGPPSALLT